MQPRVAAHSDRVFDCTCGLNSVEPSCLYCKDAHQHRRGHGKPAPKLDSPARPRHPSEHVDLYARLGLSASPPPTAAEIRLAYRARILRAHPDRLVSSDGARDGPAVSAPAERVTGEADDAHELNEAWEVLGDEEARSRYDAARRGELGYADAACACLSDCPALTPDSEASMDRGAKSDRAILRCLALARRIRGALPRPPDFRATRAAGRARVLHSSVSLLERIPDLARTTRGRRGDRHVRRMQ